MRNRKETAWRRSRKFGDAYGGRYRLKHDRFLRRLHEVRAPGPDQVQPIMIVDNPSRDFFFPLSKDEILAALDQLPDGHLEGLTHIWLRRLSKKDYEAARVPFGEMICGGGVHLIVLYPWPHDMILRYGKRRPPAKVRSSFARWTTDWRRSHDRWTLHWTEDALRAWYVEDLLLHEVGHHVDCFRRRAFSAANRKQVEDFAIQYAVEWSSAGVSVLQDRETGS